ncbi:MAG: APC family permease [Bacteroidales bacterium]|jgi:amino acid transporter|nr:APC family permease [Bacteroidales bacterium]
MSGTQTSNASGPGLKRVLGLWSLVLYGIILIQPTAPMPLYGAAATIANGHVVITVLIGMVAMLFTAISYGRMANAYPNAGSAYTYVTREIHPSLGYFVGWGMIFDYVMNPIICVIWISKAAMNFIPEIPFGVWAVAFTVLFTTMNLRGIESSSRTNSIIATGLGVVIILFLGAAARYLFIHPPANAAEWTRPFYDSSTFSFRAISAGASLAVLTYIGFDGVSTLSEEVHNPRRNILLATVLVCLITGLLASVQVYVAQLVWPGTEFPDQDTAFTYIAGRAGGQWLFYVLNFALLVASIGSGSGAHLGAGRLLYGMGRDNAIPSKFFAKINPRTRIPSNNIILVGVLTLIGAFLLTYPLGAQLLNFGALIAFMGVNVSSFVHYFLRSERKSFINFIVPVLGFSICLYLWLSLNYKAKIAGLCWLSAGVLYGAYRTSWFRKPLQFARIENGDEEKKTVSDN